MRYLVLLTFLCVQATAQTNTYGHTALPGALIDDTQAAKTAPVKSVLTANTPSTCTASKELILKSDATPGQQLFICSATGDGWVLQGDGVGGGGYTLPTASGSVLGGIKVGAGLTIDGAGVVTASGGGGGGGTINSGADRGFWFPYGITTTIENTFIDGSGSNAGRRSQIVVPAQMEFRSINFWITRGSEAAKSFQVGIYSADMATLVAYTTRATVGGTPNIGVLGAARYLFGGGSMVAGGVLTLAPGVYWVVPSTDSTQLLVAAYYNGVPDILINATTTTSETHTNGATRTLINAYSSAAVSNGTTMNANLSAMTWGSPTVTTKTPFFALVN